MIRKEAVKTQRKALLPYTCSHPSSVVDGKELFKNTYRNSGAISSVIFCRTVLAAVTVPYGITRRVRSFQLHCFHVCFCS